MKQISFYDLDEMSECVLAEFENKVVVGEVQKKDILKKDIFPTRSTVFTLIFVESGILDVELDYSSYTLKEKSFLVILPEHITQSIRSSDDFRAKFMIVDQEYFGSFDINKNRPYQPSFINIRKHPGFHLSVDETNIINSCFDRIKQKILQQNHHLRDEIIKTLLVEFILEMDNIMIERNYDSNTQKLSGQEHILHSFLLLLGENGKSEHQVTFYADRLHITPQYLALVLKTLTGKTTRNWIAHALITEAKILLKYTGMSVSQISDTLNFYDASAFGKFFKKETGFTPFLYRKS
ncbi:AraC family transcriptional regulator [Dysgonomonas sp. 520]|uniref:helix-turn-helix domain-containing protein n=1 Tax=Dysgonomonas sp. 520 TaxID=2302931 RepID=UPI0013D71ADA|nr:helix-turn-helix domain-containing protein [Dysgonomonas sp. 520]NDW10125.1 AraC family transcriptional regulator [Dysgonomonas sp. 520]